MPKLQKVGASLMLVIPAEICKLKGWQKGQTITTQVDARTGKVFLDRLEAPGKLKKEDTVELADMTETSYNH